MRDHHRVRDFRNVLVQLTVFVVFWTSAFAYIGLAQTPSTPERPEAQDVSAAVRSRIVSPAPDPIASIRSARLIYVNSKSVLVGNSVIETKLRNRPEFQRLGLVITRDEKSADLILELRHDILTKYVFTAIDPRTKVVVASGKLSSLGGTVAGKVAKRFMKQLILARQGS